MGEGGKERTKQRHSQTKTDWADFSRNGNNRERTHVSPGDHGLQTETGKTHPALF